MQGPAQAVQPLGKCSGEVNQMVTPNANGFGTAHASP